MKRIDHQSTKIVATVGPASSSKEVILDLIKSGVDVFRVNFSHGTHEDHRNVIETITLINLEFNLHVGILADLQGPKLRVGKIKDDKLKLEDGEIVNFVTGKGEGTKDQIGMSYTNFSDDVEIGDRVLVDDGKIVLQVKSKQKDNVALEVIHSGVLSSNKGVNLPDTRVSLPCLTEKDLEDLDFILTQPVHWIALSFVRTAEDIESLRKIVEEKEHIAKLIAKIEKPEAIKNMKRIISSADGIMIARGDLGVELPVEKVPFLQKKIIRRCIQFAKPVIVATELMDSMIRNPNPTRAEVTDVANAVLDGADAVMLSGETAIGKYPIRVVEAMNRIITETEKDYQISGKRPKPDKKSDTFYSDVICINAAKTAEEINAKSIISLTANGYTAFRISSYRPKCRIHIFSDRHQMLSILHLVWGVKCFYYDKFTTTDETIEDVVAILKAKGEIEPGQIVVNTGAMPIGRRFRTNMLKVTLVE